MLVKALFVSYSEELVIFPVFGSLEMIFCFRSGLNSSSSSGACFFGTGDTFGFDPDGVSRLLVSFAVFAERCFGSEESFGTEVFFVGTEGFAGVGFWVWL